MEQTIELNIEKKTKINPIMFLEHFILIRQIKQPSLKTQHNQIIVNNSLLYE